MRFWVFVCSALSLFASERLEFKRSDGSLLVAHFDAPETAKTHPLLLVVQGAQRESALRFQNSLKESAQPGWGLLSIEKRGIEDDEEYRRHQSLEERFQDHALVLRKLKEGAIPSWNGKWAVVGQGEGGKVAAALAARYKDLSALIVVSAGGIWDVATELLQSFRQEMVLENFTPHYIQSFLVLAKGQLEAAQEDPTWEKECFGFSHLYWASLLKARLAEDLGGTQCPIYYIHGDQDDRIPTASVDALIKQLKDKPGFSYRRSADMGREISRSQETYKDALGWLKGKLL